MLHYIYYCEASDIVLVEYNSREMIAAGGSIISYYQVPYYNVKIRKISYMGRTYNIQRVNNVL